MNTNQVQPALSRFCRPVILLLAALLPLSVLCASANGATTIQNRNWTVTASDGEGSVQVAYAGLGAFLTDLRLYAQANSPLGAPLAHWTVSQQGQTTLTIHASEPATTWTFSIQANALLISSTSPDALIVASMPAPETRIPARLLDSEGTPVVWKGTNEAQEAYGGDEISSPSFLPRHNPQVGYFALGLASVAGFHSLFDRPSDIAIDFPTSTSMQRDSVDRAIVHLRIPVRGNALVRVIPDYYTRVLGVPSYTPYAGPNKDTAPVIWNSWNAYYAAVTEKDIVESTDWLAKNLKAYGLQYVVLDAGYSAGVKNHGALWLDWVKDKFPSGPQWLSQYIHSRGFKPGVWIVPNTAGEPFNAHPDWYVRSKQSNFMLDYGGPVLDSSNPEVLEFLRSMFTTFHNWGFQYFKFDGEHSVPKSAPDLDTSLLHDAFSDPTQVYRHRMQVIRDAVGPDTFLEGCPAGRPLDGIGFFNSYSNGFDLYSNWNGMYSMFSAISANTFLNHIVTYVMPGEGLSLNPIMSVAETRKRRVPEFLTTIEEREVPASTGTSDPEARTMVSIVALTGVAYPVADYLLDLPAERIDLLHKTLPTVGILPTDLFSRGSNITFSRFHDISADDFIHNYPEVIDLKINRASLDYDVAALTNWRGTPQSRSLSFSNMLALPVNQRYIVFDFWRQQPLGVFSDTVEVSVDPHDTRVLQIYPLLDHPQLLGTSRHITGAYSVREEVWDETASTLRGVSETIPGEPYSLWFHLPARFAAGGLTVSINGIVAKSVEQAREGEFIKFTLPGQQDPLAWSLKFQPHSSGSHP